MFLVAMLVLWTGTMTVLMGGKDALGWAILTGCMFGYWAVLAVAAFDKLSKEITTGIRAQGLFLLMVASALGLFWLAFGTSDANMKGIVLYGGVLGLIVLCYLVRGIVHRP